MIVIKLTMFSRYYHESMRKIKKDEGKKYLMVKNYELDKVLEIIKEMVGIEKLDNTKMLVDTDDKLPDDVTF